MANEFLLIIAAICFLVLICSIYEIRRTEVISKIIALLTIAALRKNTRESKALLDLLIDKRPFFMGKEKCENINNQILEIINGKEPISSFTIMALRNFYVNGKFTT